MRTLVTLGLCDRHPCVWEPRRVWRVLTRATLGRGFSWDPGWPRTASRGRRGPFGLGVGLSHWYTATSIQPRLFTPIVEIQTLQGCWRGRVRLTPWRPVARAGDVMRALAQCGVDSVPPT